MGTIRAAIYLRISLDQTGERLAVERQREDCEALAGARGWNVTEVYTDNSVSASKRSVRRPSYERMVADFHAAKFDALICYDLDRLTRQPRQLEDWIEAAEERGLLLVTANGEADLTTDGGRMFARIKASVARAEVERKSARQIRASQQRADMGKIPSGVRLTGYTDDGGIDAIESLIVRDVFDCFAAGESLKGVAAELNLRSVPTREWRDKLVATERGSKWHPSTVRTMLTNPRYAGRAVYRGKPTGKLGAWEPIVSEAVFDAVQARLNDPRRITNRVGTDRKYLGSGIFLCGVCGIPVRTNGPRYWCPTGGHVTRTLAPIDDLVTEVIRARLAMPDVAQLAAPKDDKQLIAADAKSRELRARLETIEADYDAGHIDGTRFAVAAEKVRAELRQVESDRATALLGGAAGGFLGSANPVATFDRASLAARRALTDALMTVRLMPVPRGRKGFDPNTVLIEWKHSQT